MRTITLVMLDAAIEVATGVALIVDPALVARALLGTSVSEGGIAVGRPSMIRMGNPHGGAILALMPFSYSIARNFFSTSESM